MNKRGQNRSFSLCNFSSKNRRGQFYLVAAIVIISVSVGFIVISNSVSSSQTPNILYQRDEMKIESANVITNALNNQLSGIQLTNNLADYSQRYIHLSRDENFYFAFGNSTNMTFMAYQAYFSNVTLYNQIDYTNLVGVGNTYITNFAPGNNVTININGASYIFPISPGENFNFVLTSYAGGQNYTAIS